MEPFSGRFLFDQVYRPRFHRELVTFWGVSGQFFFSFSSQQACKRCEEPVPTPLHFFFHVPSGPREETQSGSQCTVEELSLLVLIVIFGDPPPVTRWLPPLMDIFLTNSYGLQYAVHSAFCTA